MRIKLLIFLMICTALLFCGCTASTTYDRSTPIPTVKATAEPVQVPTSTPPAAPTVTPIPQPTIVRAGGDDSPAIIGVEGGITGSNYGIYERRDT